MAKAVALPVRERGVCCPPGRLMKPDKVAGLSKVLKAVADPTRLQMVVALRDAKDPVCVCDFTATFDLSQPTVSHHMAKLRSAGIVESTRQGIWSYYRLREDLSAATRRLLESLG